MSENYRTLPDDVLEWPSNFRVFLHPNDRIPTRKENESDEKYRKRVIASYCNYDPLLLYSYPHYGDCLYVIYLAYAYARTLSVISCAVTRELDGSSSSDSTTEEEYGCGLSTSSAFWLWDSSLDKNGCINFYDIARISVILKAIGDLYYVGSSEPSINEVELADETATLKEYGTCDGHTSPPSEGILDDIYRAEEAARKKAINILKNSIKMPEWTDFPQKEIKEACEILDSSSSSKDKLCALGFDSTLIAKIFDRAKLANWYLYELDSIGTSGIGACIDVVGCYYGMDSIRATWSVGDKDYVREFPKSTDEVSLGTLTLSEAIENTEFDDYYWNTDKTLPIFHCGVVNFTHGKAIGRAKLILWVSIKEENIYGSLRLCEQHDRSGQCENIEIEWYDRLSRYTLDQTTTHNTKIKLVSYDITVVYNADTSPINVYRIIEGKNTTALLTADEIKDILTQAAGNSSISPVFVKGLTYSHQFQDCVAGQSGDTKEYTMLGAPEAEMCIGFGIYAIFCDTPYLRLQD